jgi:polysaccharide biosynthesis/export protein
MLLSKLLISALNAQQNVPTTNQTDTSLAQPATAPGGTPGTSSSVRADSHPETPRIANPEIRIGAGDLLQVTVYGATDYDQQVRVSESGDVSLPMIGTLKLGGLSISQAEQLVAAKLSDGGFFNNPSVSIFEKEYATQGISVFGEVQKPGIYPLLGSRTLFDAISVAGGTTPKAGNLVTITHRDNPNQPQRHTLSYGPSGPVTGNTPVYPGDTIVVSKAGIVYVIGDVRMPSGIIMENSKMTVLQALAMAQGANPSASLNKSRIIRETSAGRQEIPIAIKNILNSKAPDQALQPNDIVFIPSSAAKAATRRSIDAALQTAVGVAIYRP